MKSKQNGISLLGMLIVVVALVLLAVLGMKIAPAYMEYFTVKKIVADIADSGETSPQEIRASFQRRAEVEFFDDVTANDLVLSRDEIAFAYEKRIPLFANLTLLIDFEGSSPRSSSE